MHLPGASRPRLTIMRLFRKALGLAPGDYVLLLQALATVTAIRFSLWLLPSRLLLKRVARLVDRASMTASPTPDVRRIGWAVRRASRFVPQATCLTQALSTQTILARRGYRSILRIGVAKTPEEGFAAHAWVEINGGILVGGAGAHQYQVLPDLKPR